ncbi:hypothetical protein Q8F55_004297 [Vanrija albida]|uniref:ABC transporter domain-containing protein n=1 Tax=Vanrija albida TaxID=181172 RepID=A0ABR3Q6C5_9TREE
MAEEDGDPKAPAAAAGRSAGGSDHGEKQEKQVDQDAGEEPSSPPPEETPTASGSRVVEDPAESADATSVAAAPAALEGTPLLDAPTASGTASTGGPSSSSKTGPAEPSTPVTLAAPAAATSPRDAPTIVAPRYSDDEKALEKREWEVGREEVDGEDTSALLNLPPPPPFDLEVDGLTVGVPHPKYERLFGLLRGEFKRKPKTDDETSTKRKVILNDVSVACHQGEVLAILGGSGSGKTTLLNAVAHRMADLPTLAGHVAYVSPHSGSELSKSEARRRIGFVRQQDYLVECLTVRETLTYAARLRLPTNLSSEAISLIVEQTLDELGLRDAADTVVGGPLRKGISGGEKRRLSIGCVLVTLPSVLILDEPTSGLDAYTSYLLLRTLSALARRGRTVILSIHAPRSDAFPLFDRLCLLSKGKVVYSGPRSECLPWFHNLGHDVEVGVNPLDFLIDVSSIDNRTPENEEASRARVLSLTNAWEAHLKLGKEDFTVDKEKERTPRNRRSTRGSDRLWSVRSSTVHGGGVTSVVSDKKTNDLLAPPRADGTTPGGLQRIPSGTAADQLQRIVSTTTEDGSADQKRPGFWKQTAVLTSRAHRNVYRNFPTVLGLVCQGIVLGVIVGATYYKLPENPTGIQSMKNLSFQLIPGVFYLQQVFWIYKFCTDLIIFDREREDRLYEVVPWVIADWLSFLVPAIVAPTVYMILVYFISELRMDDVASRLFTVIASTMVVQFSTQGLALLVTSVTRSFPEASLFANAVNIFQILSAGFAIVHPPQYVKWIRWISPYFYSFRIVCTVIFKDRTFDCPQDSQANLDQCIGNNVLRGFDFDYDINLGAWFGGLLGWVLAQYAIACLILHFYNGGGVRHASEIDSHNRGKTTDVDNSHMTRDRIDVEVQGLSLNWERRGHGVVKTVKKTILNDISLRFPAGEISAILGPSGAGKSTLLQILANRKLNAGPMARFYRTGELFFAGQKANSLAWSNVAFVEQEDDWHLPSLTVRETLRYAAILRLPTKIPKKQKIARAETVLRMLGLKDCADLPVGGPLVKGISGGEKRRLSLAVQMINDPAVLVVDEPTSGLDSSIALSVMQVLKDIAATGRTVIATIHQPRSDIWRLADNVTLLAKGGIVAFNGRQSEAVNYFNNLGYPMPSAYFNPADHLLDLVSVDPRPGPPHDASERRVQRITGTWHAVEGKEVGDEPTKEAVNGDGNGSSPSPPSSAASPAQPQKITRGEGTTPMRIALPVVLSRHWISLWRQKEVLFNRWFQSTLMGAMFLLFFQRLTHGPQGAQDRIGISIQSTQSVSFVGLINAMAVLPAERNLYLHEAQSSARYSPGTFVIMYTLVEQAPQIFSALVYGAIMNVGVGMQTSARIYFEFITTIWALLNMGESMALATGMWVRSPGLTVTIISTLLSVVGQISGIMSLSVPKWMADVAWFTCYKAAVRIQVINEYLGLKFNCTPEEVSTGKCIAQNGGQVIALFGWSDLNTAKFTGIIVAVAIGWRLLAYFSVVGRVGGFR